MNWCTVVAPKVADKPPAEDTYGQTVTDLNGHWVGYKHLEPYSWAASFTFFPVTVLRHTSSSPWNHWSVTKFKVMGTHWINVMVSNHQQWCLNLLEYQPALPWKAADWVSNHHWILLLNGLAESWGRSLFARAETQSTIWAATAPMYACVHTYSCTYKYCIYIYLIIGIGWIWMVLGHNQTSKQMGWRPTQNYCNTMSRNAESTL